MAVQDYKAVCMHGAARCCGALHVALADGHLHWVFEYRNLGVAWVLNGLNGQTGLSVLFLTG
jgi:hypothetical protein